MKKPRTITAAELASKLSSSDAAPKFKPRKKTQALSGYSDANYDKYEKIVRSDSFLWKTKDGRFMKICDMENGHLVNTIKMLSRAAEYSSNTGKANKQEKMYKAMLFEARKRELTLPIDQKTTKPKPQKQNNNFNYPPFIDDIYDDFF